MARPPEDEIDRDVADEQTPLLADSGSGSGKTLDPEVKEVSAPAGEPPHLQRQNVIVLAFFIIATIAVGSGMLRPVLNSMMEKAICQDHYPELRGISLADDDRCKTPEVQGALAMLRGWSFTLEAIPGLLLSIPYGMLADKIGRRPVLFLSWLGTLLSVIWIQVCFLWPNIFPTWMLLLEAAFLIIGGSPITGVAMVYTSLADVVPVAERASVFFQLNAVLLVADLIASALAGLMMARSDWLAMEASTAFCAISLLATLAMPETMKEPPLHAAEGDDTASPSAGGKPASALVKALHVLKAQLAEVWTFVLGNKRIVLLILPLCFIVVSQFVQDLLLQYATKRYHWSWSHATYLLTIRSVSTLVLNAAVLPAVSVLCLKKLGMSPMARDIWLSRISGAFALAGATLVAFSANPWMLSISLVIFSIGGGFVALMRNLILALVESHHTAIVNTLIGFLETAGIMVAGPMYAQALRTGFAAGGAWVGLPFICAAVFAGAGTAILCVVPIPPERAAAGAADEQEP